VALLEKRGFLYNHSGDFPQVILIIPSHVPNTRYEKYVHITLVSTKPTGGKFATCVNDTGDK
jgi:hypothetical protein